MLGRVKEERGFLRGNLLVIMVSYMVFGFTSGLMGTLRSLAKVPAATVFAYLYEANRAYPYYVKVVIEVVTVAIIYALVAEPTEAEEWLVTARFVSS